MRPTYKFKEQVERQEAYARGMDKFYSKNYKLEPVNIQDDRKGWDRVFITPTGERLKMEYKTDFKAKRTGNAFVEICSVGYYIKEYRCSRPGWAYTSQADFLIYNIADLGPVYHIHMNEVKDQVKKWKKEYKVVEARNEGYISQGILVPLDVFEEIALWVYPNAIEPIYKKKLGGRLKWIKRKK